jgi:Trk K+ transport system NAD-binding subunit
MWFLPALLIILFAIKLIPSMMWVRLFGFRRSIAGGFLVSSRLSLIIAASAIGLDMGVVTPGINAAFILMAIATCLLSPVIFNILNPRGILDGQKTIIVGGSSTGVLLSRRLHAHDKSSIIIEKDPKRFKAIQEKGLNVVLGDGTKEEIYRQLKLSAANYIILETGSDETNLQIAHLLREQFLHENIIARTKLKSIENKLNLMNVDTVDERRVLATTLENLILRPNTYHDLVESFDNYIIEEIMITNDEIDGKQIKDIPFQYNAILMMIKSGNELKIPHGDTYLKKGDIIHIFGTPSALLETHKLVE